MEQPKNILPNNEPKPQNGLDNWNNRLDENLEPEDENDESADSRAKAFSEQYNDEEQAEDSDN